jgi:hypothetical protein
VLAQTLIVTGALLFGLLGTLHLGATFFTDNFNARDAATTAAMKATSPVLTRRTSLWNAWVGFNASHGLGAMLFGAIYMVLALGHMQMLSQSPALLWLAVAGSLGYLALAQRYWFRTPLVGIALASTCFFMAALVLSL